MGQVTTQASDTCHCQLLAGSTDDCDDRQLWLTRTSCYFFLLWIKGIQWQFPRMLGDIYIHPETLGWPKAYVLGFCYITQSCPSTPGQRSCPTSQTQDPNIDPSKAMDRRLFFTLSLVFAFQ